MRPLSLCLPYLLDPDPTLIPSLLLLALDQSLLHTDVSLLALKLWSQSPQQMPAIGPARKGGLLKLVCLRLLRCSDAGMVRGRCGAGWRRQS